MPRAAGVLLLCVGVSLVCGCASHPGTGTFSPAVKPVVERAHATTTLPLFRASFTYNGTTYPYTMVGSDPFTAPSSVSIRVAIVPLRLTFPGGSVLDATSVAASLPKSPLFTNASYPPGVTQYADAEMRSEFWSAIGNGTKNYHLFLTSAFEPTQSVSVPSGDGSTAGSGGQLQGFVSFAWFIETEERQLIANLKIPPTDLTMFVTYSTKVLEPGNHCCYSGYHYYFTSTTSAGTQEWTTAWASVTSTSITHMGHEVVETLNDPFYGNRVPSWKSPLTGGCGGSDLEVGDPVETYLFTVNGVTLEDAAFVSWFARAKPSSAIHGWYDLEHHLSAPASNCT